MKTCMYFERSSLKTGVENLHFFGPKSGQDLRNWAAHPHQEFPGVTPLPPPPVEPHDYHIYYVNINFLSCETFLRARRPQRRRARRNGRFRRLRKKGLNNKHNPAYRYPHSSPLILSLILYINHLKAKNKKKVLRKFK